MSSPQNVVQLSVHLATMLLDVTMGFLERILGEELSPPTLGVLGESFLFSTLLPTTLAQLGPVACRQPKVSCAHPSLNSCDVSSSPSKSLFAIASHPGGVKIESSSPV